MGLEPWQAGSEAHAFGLFALRKWFRFSSPSHEASLVGTVGSGWGLCDCLQLTKDMFAHSCDAGSALCDPKSQPGVLTSLKVPSSTGFPFPNISQGAQRTWESENRT